MKQHTTVVAISTQAVAALTSLVAGIIAARLMLLEARGLAATAVAYASLAAYLTDLGLTPAVQYFVAKGQQPARTVRDGPTLAVLTAAMVAGLLLFLVLPFQLHNVVILIAMAVYIASNFFSRTVAARLFGAGLFNQVNLIRILQSVTWLTILVFALTIEASPPAYLIAFAASWLLQAIALVVTLRKHPLPPPNRPSATMTVAFWRYALAAHLSGQNAIDSWRVDLIAASFFAGPAAVAQLAIAGSYGVQVKIVSLATGPILNVGAASSGRTRDYRSNVRSTIYLTIAGGVFLAVAAPFLVTTVFGPSYGAAVLPASIYSLSFVFSAARNSVSEVLRGRGMNTPPVIAEVGTLAVFLLAMGTTGRNSVLGIAIAVLIAQMAGVAGLVLAVAFVSRGVRSQ